MESRLASKEYGGAKSAEHVSRAQPRFLLLIESLSMPAGSFLQKISTRLALFTLQWKGTRSELLAWCSVLFARSTLISDPSKETPYCKTLNINGLRGGLSRSIRPSNCLSIK